MNKSLGLWESAYSLGGHNTLWPWSDLVSLVSRHCCPISSPEKFNMLELGCGPGANIPFFLSLKVIIMQSMVVPRLLTKFIQLFRSCLRKL